MTEWLGLLFDVILIVFVGVGVVQVMRLIRQLRDLRASRVEMDRFVREFNGAVIRAEAGIKSLRAAARESGDDLEKLVGKAVMVRDELNFIVESADRVAERLTASASNVIHGEPTSPRQSAAPQPSSAPTAAAASAVSSSAPQSASAPSYATKADAQPSSRAEKELLQALQKMK